MLIAAIPITLLVSEPVVRVEWEGPRECDAPEAVEAKLRELVPDMTAPMVVSGVVRPEEAGLSVTLVVTVDDDTIERVLAAETCAELLDAAVLVAAIAAGADPLQEPEAPAPEPAVAECPEPPTIPPLAAAPPQAEESPRPPASRWSLGAEGGLSTHVLTPLTFAIGGRLERLFGAWRVAVGAHHHFGRNVIVDEWVETRIHLTRGSVAGCRALRTGRWEFPLCIGVSAGSLVKQPLVGIRGPERGHLFWGAAEVSGGATVLATPEVAFYARAELLVPFVRPRLQLGQGEERYTTYRVPPAGASFALGMAFRVP